ncbi:hypothetical protein B5S31_g2521 [[Candida] boidinii]|uniref:Unnamed protein product n=1 Tax=Candida boidinii TaxID=5477 RepID=A0ACB5TM90_CANBO|nr:hypothetical protein B5S29_g493 [[Candida] boidinii]OWB72799.1 hypothetical protein B5S31_g2521 [[Candida] boidinii]OWB77663.1 hypothetical protein B5S32_g1837 [[Candida] boidinii]GME91505.1 unnamed protein product [[Candida] boidinii]GME97378.1 unnamed protein product [[Candida] boidinii]
MNPSLEINENKKISNSNPKENKNFQDLQNTSSPTIQPHQSSSSVSTTESNSGDIATATPNSIDDGSAVVFEDLDLNSINSNSTPLSPSTPSSPSQTTITPKIRRKSGKKSNKCSLKGCCSAPLRMVGDCQYCKGKFCSRHRLLENHFCSGLESCKEQLHKRNAIKLQSEQTIASKV